MNPKRFILAAATVLAIAFSMISLAPAASAADSGYTSTTISIDKPTVAPGAAVVITGSGFQAGSTVTLSILNAQNEEIITQTVQADASGNVSATVTVPQGASGVMSVSLTGTGTNGNPLTLNGGFTVADDAPVDPTPVPVPTALPYTGSNTSGLLLVGSAVALAGAGLVLVSRRARTRQG